MQADLEALNLDSAGTLSPAGSLPIDEADSTPEDLAQEVRWLRSHLQQQGLELLQERHRVQSLQQQLALQQQAAEGAREVHLLEYQACSSPHGYDAAKLRFGDFDEGLLQSNSSLKQEQQQQQLMQGRHHGGLQRHRHVQCADEQQPWWCELGGCRPNRGGMQRA